MTWRDGQLHYRQYPSSTAVVNVCTCMYLQSFVVKVERDGQQEAQLVQRTFEEFQELHSKLRLQFPSCTLPRYTHTDTHSLRLYYTCEY